MKILFIHQSIRSIYKSPCLFFLGGMLGSEGLYWQSSLQEDVCQNEEFKTFDVVNTDVKILHFPAVRQMIRMLYFQREKGGKVDWLEAIQEWTEIV